MKCPHCLEAFHDEWQKRQLAWPANQLFHERIGLEDKFYVVAHTVCPTCKRVTISVSQNVHTQAGPAVDSETMVWPRQMARSPLPPEVADPFAADYREACLVLADSPKASAALSRRCLQRLLREQGKVTLGNLSSEIDQVMKTLPTYLAEAVDGVRNIGNFAAHPNKSTNTGEVIDVEPGEAEWLLETLEGLFDFYFVQPKRLADKRAALNQKLGDTGQKPMK